MAIAVWIRIRTCAHGPSERSYIVTLFMRNSLQVVEVGGKVGHLKSEYFDFGWPMAGREGDLNWSFQIWSLSTASPLPTQPK